MKYLSGNLSWMLSTICLFLAWAPSPSTQNHYCSISKDHTLCKFQGIGPRCKTPFAMGISSAERQQIMELHNSLRMTVATGNEGRGRPGPQPMASNMRQLEWDDELALTAQRLADQCKYNHDCLNCRKVDRFLTGQNLYQFSENILRDGSNWPQAIMAWYDEVALFNPRSVDYFDFVKELGHYTQMLWADTYKVGCGYAYFNEGKWNRKLYICNYGPAGNIITTQMYKRGSPCSECPEGTSCSNQYPGLCSGGGGGRPVNVPAPAPPVTRRPTFAPTTRRTTTTTTTTTTRRPTTTTTTTTTPRPTTTVPSKIIFNELESNEIGAFDNFLEQPVDIASRIGNENPPRKSPQQTSSRITFLQPTRTRFQTTSAPRRNNQPTFSRFAATTRRNYITTTYPTTTRRPTTTTLATRRPFTFSPRVYPELEQKNKQSNRVNRFQSTSNAVVSKPQQGIKDNRISSSTINFPQTQNRFTSKQQQFQGKGEGKVIRVVNTPALSVEDTNSIMLFCDFDFAKCPVRYMGDLWNYTAYETPGYGHGFATILAPGRETSLQIRSDVSPSGSEGLICVHFRFVHYLFGVDGGPSKSNGLGPDGRPVIFTVTANTVTQSTTVVEMEERSKSAYDWLTGRVQFSDLHDKFILSFHLPRNPVRDNVYLAVDDILITQGLCHT